MSFIYGSTFRLDSMGNVVIEPGGDISMITQYEKVNQDLTVILRSLRGQYMFDTEFGIDYRTYLDNKQLNNFIYTQVTPAIQNYYFCKQIVELNGEYKNGTMYITGKLILYNNDEIDISLAV